MFFSMRGFFLKTTIEKFNFEKARKAQKLLANKAVFKNNLPSTINVVTGVDVSYKGDKAFSAAVSIKFPHLEILEVQKSITNVKFPYVPTFLFFREASPIISVIKKLENKPDLLLIDGNGLLHPFKAGEATLIGVYFNIPTIGVAKNLLCGNLRDLGIRNVKGVIYKGELVGYEITLGGKRKPIYVSPGHKVSLETSLKIVTSLIKHRTPEPLRLAHFQAKKLMKSLE